MLSIKNIALSYCEYDTVDELEAMDRELINSAIQAAESAYAPYSGFRVGAAVRLDTGETVSGSNVENAAFPSGTCAERCALSACWSGYPGKKPAALAIAAISDGEFTDDPVPPCGNCRQLIAEEEMRHGKPVRIILSGRKKTLVFENSKILLPFQFNKNNITRAQS